jgi:hypothetical protein
VVRGDLKDRLVAERPHRDTPQWTSGEVDRSRGPSFGVGQRDGPPIPGRQVGQVDNLGRDHPLLGHHAPGRLKRAAQDRVPGRHLG